MKSCTKCGMNKNVSEFSFVKNGQSRRKARCKKCHGATARVNYHKNRNYYLEYAKTSRQDPAVKRRINDRRNAARRENPEITLYRLAKVRARTKGLPFNLEPSDIVIPKKCPALDIELVWGCARRQIDCSPTVDRKVPALGYVKGNVAVISWRANRLKSDATLDELRAILKYVQVARQEETK